MQAFKSLLENHFHADSVETRVGHAWSGYMTKTRALNMVRCNGAAARDHHGNAQHPFQWAAT